MTRVENEGWEVMSSSQWREERVVGQHRSWTEEERRESASFGQTVVRRLEWIKRVSAELQAEG